MEACTLAASTSRREVPELEPTDGPLRGAGPQGQGAVSSVLLGFLGFDPLPPASASTVLALTIEPTEPVSERPQSVRVAWRDGMQGSGHPVSNQVVTRGEVMQFCACQSAVVNFVAQRNAAFIRCDPNQDGRFDIADAIWIVDELFRRGPRYDCLDAEDCNGDRSVDISDATYGVAYQFTGGAPPPPPFPRCDFAVEMDSLGCEEFSCP